MEKIKYDLNNYQALLFDLDGTLINSMPYHNKAWIDAFKDYGVEITEAFLMETAGMKSTRIVSIVNERYSSNLNPEEVSLHKRNKYLQNLELVEIVEPVAAIIREFHNKIPMGIITGGSHAVVDKLLPKLKLDHYFKTIVCADDTELGKDSTAPYELASNNLSVDMDKCIFFDDGDVGLKGAKLSGMDVVHVDINQDDIFINATI